MPGEIHTTRKGGLLRDPVAAAFGVLTVWWLLAAVLLAGVFSVFFDVAHPTYLPRLVSPSPRWPGRVPRGS
ncbi:MAG: transporter [Amycolatopsis sp.]|uniref:hypothetical protein n=1 Tax=Amycolatopsis sp. TaxID=37632 RepID=UPI0026325806|nr:hypothetical protein [Amycolatopsis sp.]MCU1687361.1 transporter [Amycolatopsis sp.]